MDQNEFKCLILNQFKKSESPIHTLMLDYTKGPSRYFERRGFLASEFNLCIMVETVDDDGKFQVFFGSADEIQKKNPTGFALDFSNLSLNKWIYATEEIEVGADSVIFSLNRFTVEAEGYVFKKQPTKEEPVSQVIYRRGGFFGPLYVDDMIRKCKENISSDDVLYVGFKSRAKDIKKVMKLAKANQACLKQAKWLSDIFMYTSQSSKESAFIQVINHLNS